jgi:hypothetical protein
MGNMDGEKGMFVAGFFLLGLALSLAYVSPIK